MPVEGAAKEELLRTLARFLGVHRRDVRLLGGAGGRVKRVEVAGLGVADVLAKIGA